ncbi:MAG TPA: alpha/beta hydrolase [Tepidisphaeraceae bacterium]|nr:alpha/beta hydrolase [Tepidisphaeraceae bacterium]
MNTPTEPIRLWPQRAPLATGDAPDDVPTITPYGPDPGRATGTAFVVCPGGGYAGLAAHEGEPVAQWLASLGVAAFVLKYRLGPKYREPAALLDAQRAIRTVRARGGEWGLGGRRVGILGFSAGGHLAATASNQFDDGDPTAADLIDRHPCRPDLSMPIYPVISMQRGVTHDGSRQNLLGEGPSAELAWRYSNELRVTPRTPPTFLFHTADDKAVPVENALLYVLACRRAGVPCELHVYERGAHGVGLAPDDPILRTWPDRAADWLALHGFARKA